MSSILSRFFPMPRFLAMRGGGIEISDRSIKYMRFTGHNLESARVVAFGEIPLPTGAIADGEIHDPAALLKVLRQVRAACRFSLCYASLPESKGYLFSDQLPRSAAADVEGALALALSSHVPLAPAEAVYDCELMLEESSAEQVSIVAAATSEEIALSYSQALGAAGFLPLSFELEPQAAARAILAGKTVNPDRAVIIADLGQTKTMLCVVERGVPRFTTSSEGSEVFDNAIAAAGVDVREIIRRKIDIGIVQDAHDDTRVFLQLADRFAEEIARLAAYWNAHGPTQGGRASVGSVVIYGGNANIKGLAEYLSHKVRLQVGVAHVWEAFGSSRRIHPITADQFMRFATVAGLALRALQHAAVK